MPDVIALRRRYIPEGADRTFIAASVFDQGWLDAIRNRKDAIILFAGVLYYFEEERVRRLFTDFGERFEAVNLKLRLRLFNDSQCLRITKSTFRSISRPT